MTQAEYTPKMRIHTYLAVVEVSLPLQWEELEPIHIVFPQANGGIPS